MELEVELSHLVFAELYNILAGRKSLSDMLEVRLNSIDLNHSWLREASDLYNAKWHEIRKDAHSAADFTHLSSEHAHFASWILACLRGTGQCEDISIELRSSVTERFIEEVPCPPAQPPSPWKPVIQGWALGMVIGQFDHDLPAIPPKMEQDASVCAALEGLIEHLLFINNACSSWPEVSATAVHWRGSGLLEAMQLEAQNLPDAMRLLIPTIRQYLSDSQGRILGQHFSTMVQSRNSLTHIADLPSCPGFVDVVSEWSGEHRIKNTVRGVTELLFAQYSSTLADPRSINPKIWEQLHWEIEIFG